MDLKKNADGQGIGRIERLLGLLVAAPSPSGSEQEVARLVKEFAVSHGESPEEVEGNILIPICRGSRKAVILNAHMDTVDAHDGWQTDPLTLTKKGGRYYGLGVSDEKASIAILLDLIDRLKEKKEAPKDSSMLTKAGQPADVFLAFVVNEEIDGSGSKALAAHFKNEYLARYDDVMCVICEPTDARWIELGNKGSVFFEMVCSGKAAHGSKPEQGENAVKKIIKLIAKVESSFEKFGSSIDSLGHPSLAIPTTIRGGSSVNVIPDNCVATGDIRTNTLCHSSVLGFLAGIPEVRVISQVPPYLLRGRPDLVELFEKAGIAERRFTTGSNDAVFFGQVGTPAIVFGAGNKECIHQSNEFIDMASLEKTEEIYLRIIESFSSVGPSIDGQEYGG